MQQAATLPMMKTPGLSPPALHTERITGQVSSSDHDRDYRNLAVNRLRPSEIQWALNHDAVHGIAYAFRNPVAVAESLEDPDDDRRTYLVRVKRDDLANALEKINEWIRQSRPGRDAGLRIRPGAVARRPHRPRRRG